MLPSPRCPATWGPDAAWSACSTHSASATSGGSLSQSLQAPGGGHARRSLVWGTPGGRWLRSHCQLVDGWFGWGTQHGPVEHGRTARFHVTKHKKLLDGHWVGPPLGHLPGGCNVTRRHLAWFTQHRVWLPPKVVLKCLEVRPHWSF